MLVEGGLLQQIGMKILCKWNSNLFYDIVRMEKVEYLPSWYIYSGKILFDLHYMY